MSNSKCAWCDNPHNDFYQRPAYLGGSLCNKCVIKCPTCGNYRMSKLSACPLPCNPPDAKKIVTNSDVMK